MMFKNTLRLSLPIAFVIGILALTGMFGQFSSREVVKGVVSLSVTVLLFIFALTGYLVARQPFREKQKLYWLHGIIGAGIIGVVLAFLVILESFIDLRFVFANLTQPMANSLALGQESIWVGAGLLVGLSALCGLLGSFVVHLREDLQRVVFTAVALTAVVGLLESQIRNIMPTIDAIAICLIFIIGYLVGTRLALQSPIVRVLAGIGVGAVSGLILYFLATNTITTLGGTAPVILSSNQSVIALVLSFAFIGAIGALTAGAFTAFHNGMFLFVAGLLVIGILNAQRGMTLLAAFITFAILFVAMVLSNPLNERAKASFERLTRGQQQGTQRFAMFATIGILVFLPMFAGQYITNVLNGVGLYIVMGIGLNIVVGYAGLLDLGYVAFYAIGAYSIGLLTTPSLLTCGGAAPSTITPENIAQTCSGIMTFWEAWPVSILMSATAGILLGIPVLRLRGDYLAIVTLGFGEIIRIILKFDDFKPLFGAAQGIANIPRPVIDLTSINPDWRFDLTGETGIYYLVLVTILITAFIGYRIVTTRLGRAWLAMRADEDVAQTMGVNLTRTKLLAFAVGAAFAGMGGAISGVRLFGAYPDSFTVMVSINVLSLIIIGGLGSIPGVIVGALVLVGLPEALRELSDYRLLAFGALLVAAMVLKPAGLIPPRPRRLAEEANAYNERQTPTTQEA